MKLNLVLIAALGIASTAAYGDTFTGTGAFSAFAPGTLGTCSSALVCTNGNPFWNNTSGDLVNGSNLANAGNFLGATGSFTGLTNYMSGGGQMYTQASNTPNYETSFNFVRQGTALTISLLYANSSTNNNIELGIYNSTNSTTAQTQHTIFQTFGGANLNGLTTVYNVVNPYANWGIYARGCTVNAAAGACPDANKVTYYMTQSFNTYNPPVSSQEVANHQHWALYQAGGNALQFYAALEDFAWNAASPTAVPFEGFGDYNDVILSITTNAGAGVPEPATLSIVGLGLAGLGILGRRRFKK